MGLTFALAAIWGTLNAQGHLRGVAYDSLQGHPLAGATVWLRDLDRSAFTDSAGRFVMDSVPLGPHIFLLSHPDLDSAGFGTIAASVTLTVGTDIVLAVPSIRTLWRRLCGRDSIGVDSALVFGSVQDADARALLSGVTVTVVWPHLDMSDTHHLRVEIRADSATTDSTGTYRICGVATGTSVRAQARAGPHTTGIVQIMARARPVARRDFSLSLVQVADSERGSGALGARFAPKEDALWRGRLWSSRALTRRSVVRRGGSRWTDCPVVRSGCGPARSDLPRRKRPSI